MVAKPQILLAEGSFINSSNSRDKTVGHSTDSMDHVRVQQSRGRNYRLESRVSEIWSETFSVRLWSRILSFNHLTRCWYSPILAIIASHTSKQFVRQLTRPQLCRVIKCTAKEISVCRIRKSHRAAGYVNDGLEHWRLIQAIEALILEQCGGIRVVLPAKVPGLMAFRTRGNGSVCHANIVSAILLLLPRTPKERFSTSVERETRGVSRFDLVIESFLRDTA
ncbi:hypothetical protein BJ546DRAFT_946448 [Cryomyces antarcticus]